MGKGLPAQEDYRVMAMAGTARGSKVLMMASGNLDAIKPRAKANSTLVANLS